MYIPFFLCPQSKTWKTTIHHPSYPCLLSRCNHLPSIGSGRRRGGAQARGDGECLGAFKPMCSPFPRNHPGSMFKDDSNQEQPHRWRLIASMIWSIIYDWGGWPTKNPTKINNATQLLSCSESWNMIRTRTTQRNWTETKPIWNDTSTH